MLRIARPLAFIVLLLLVPIVPFLAAGDRLETWALAWFDPPPTRWVTAVAVTAILASDIFLPIPSSLVGTLAGARLGILAGTAACWLGLSTGGVIGFALARRWGRPLVGRFSSAADRQLYDRASARFGAALVALTRPLPVLAEATVLLLGTTDLAWRRFLPALALSNLGLSLVYAVLGSLAYDHGQLAWALAASVALPLAATALVRVWGWREPAELAADSVATNDAQAAAECFPSQLGGK